MFSASKTAAPVSGSFQVNNSLRFRSSASAYLNRTPSVAGNRTTWTLSFWMKIGTNTNNVSFFCNLNASAQSGFGFDLNPAANPGSINIYDATTTYVWQLNTTQVFRDPSAWYHIVLAFDTTQATASNRVKLYVNGSQVTAFSTASYPSQNYQALWNTTASASIAKAGLYSGGYFDGYMAEVNFVDGQALTPSSFGSINATTDVWQPARYTGSYGTNGFYLKFNNGTSTTTLGNDSSGNGNNWTTNNISLTAGSTYDWMIDSPKSYAGSSYGVGNYAVLNPLSKQTYFTYNGGTLSEANLKLTNSSVPYYLPSSIVVSAGKWYFENTFTNAASSNTRTGFNIAPKDAVSGSDPTINVNIYTTNISTANNFITLNGTNQQAGLTGYDSGVVGVAIDLDNLTCRFYVNGAAYGTQVTGLTAGAYTAFVYGGTNCTSIANFGQRPFAYTPPTGFKSLCTQNLPAPTIYNGANHMAATTYTGTGSSLSISNSVNSASFQPDFVWIKSRSAATDNKLTDSVRGVTKGLISNTTGAETTDTTGLTAFGASGFTVGASINYNNSGSTYVGWQWKAGGTAVTNTSGTITSSVSANTTAGFSIVSYLNNGVASTVGHGLGVAPSMIIIKNKTVASIAGTNTEWAVYHSALGASGQVFLNLTNANTTAYSLWNSTSPTANVFSVAAFDYVNSAYPGSSGTYTYIAYCFAAIAGYSAFGSFSGNASTDGPFVYCGFRPKFVLVKCSSTTGNWYVFDSVRNTYNVLGEQLYPNSSNAGSTATTLDFLSNGFKMKTASDPNASATYIYAAFASNPFQNSLAF